MMVIYIVPNGLKIKMLFVSEARNFAWG